MTRLSKEQLLALVNEGKQMVEVDREYTHKKSGDVYCVSEVGLNESDLSLTIAYYDPEWPDVTFYRHIVDFLDKFE